MASMADVQQAKEALKARLGRPPWLRGVGIGGRSGDYCLKVNVSSVTDEVRNSIPTTIGGVPVVVEAVGQIRSHG